MSLERISCPSCGSSRFDHDAEGSLICAHCGATFGSPQHHIECSACHTQNPPQARRCMNCGQTLGKVCQTCNTPNPPGADHCLNCATPLDTLSSVFMRTKSGQDHTSNLIRSELVRTKSEDTAFMEDQRAKLDAEEQHRMQHLRQQQTEAQRQQRTIMALSIFGGAFLLCAIAYYLFVLAR